LKIKGRSLALFFFFIFFSFKIGRHLTVRPGDKCPYPLSYFLYSFFLLNLVLDQSHQFHASQTAQALAVEAARKEKPSAIAALIEAGDQHAASPPQLLTKN